MIEVLALDADQLHRRLALGRMHGADVVKVGVARTHGVGADWLDQGWSQALALLDNAPIRHFGDPDCLPVDGPAGAVVVRAAVCRPVIDMAANAEAEFGVLVEDLARIGSRGALPELGPNKVLIGQRL